MKYSKLVEFLKYTVYPNKDRIRRTVYKNYTKRMVATICIIALCFSIMSLLAYNGIMTIPTASACDVPEHLKNQSIIMSVVPTHTEENLITTDTGFRLTTSKTITVDNLKEHLEIIPKTNYKLVKTSGNTFKISFENKLAQNTVYKIESKNNEKTVYSWAFQTTTEFNICNVSPNGTASSTSDPIEIEFSHSDVENLPESFTIYPSIAGTFEKYGNKWFFIPSTEYEKDILYTVTIDKSVSNSKGKRLDENFSFSFYFSEEKDKDYIKTVNTSADSIATYSAKDIPQIHLQYEGVKINSANITVYKVKSSQDFIRLNKTHLTPLGISTSISQQLSNCVKLDTFTVESSKENGLATLFFEETLEKGQYIIEIEIGNYSLYQMIQITDIVSDYFFDNNSLYVFANYKNNSSPLKSASVSLEGQSGAFTDEDGIAYFEYVQQNDESKYMTIVKDNDTYVCMVTEPDNSDLFEQVLFTECSKYNPGDNVKVKGFSRPNCKLRVNLSFTDKYLECKSNSTGYFEAEFIVPENILDDLVKIQIIDSGEIVSESEIGIVHDAPLYTLSVSSDKKSYLNGDKAIFDIKVTNADGIAVPDIEIKTPDGKTVVTDENGKAVYNESVIYTASDKNRFPEKHIKTFSLTSEENITSSTEYYIFESEIYVFYNLKETAQKQALTINASFIRESAKKGDFFEYKINSISDFVGETFNEQLLLQLHEVTTNDKNKTEDELISEFEISFKNGKANSVLPEFKENANYYAVICTKENKQPLTTITLTENPSYSNQLTLVSDKNEYLIGETVTLNLQNENGAVSEGRILVCLSSEKETKNILFSCQDKITFEFEGKTSVKAIYFDGNVTHKIDEFTLENLTNKLSVDIKTDKNTYLPNGNVNADITILDKDNKPVSCDLVILASNAQSFLSSSDYHKPLYFEHIRTNEKGTATITFDAKEDLGDYAIRVFAHSDNLSGLAEKSFTIHKDFYISSTAKDNYQDTEDITVFTQVNSTRTPEPIQLTATVIKDGSKISEIINEIEVNSDVSLNLGKLSKGRYKLRITARGSGVVDTKEFGFSVNEISNSADTTEIYTLENGLSLNPSDYASDISITFMDEKYDLYLSVANLLKELSQDTFLNRASFVTANNFLKTTPLAAKDYRYVRKLSYESFDIFSIIRMAPEITSYSNPAILEQIVLNLMYSTTDTTEILQCYYALACLGKPVLDELYGFENILSDLSDEQIIYLSLAYAYSGDYSTAYKIYEENIVPKLKSANGISSYESDGTLQRTVYMSAITSKLCSKISAENSRELIKYIISDKSNINSYSDVLVTFINECTPETNPENTVYISDSIKDSKEISYNGSEFKTITIPSSEAENIYIENSFGTSIAIVNSSKIQKEAY